MLEFKKIFKAEAIIIIVSILLLGYFGISIINKNYQKTISLAVNNSVDQAKISESNRNLLNFILIDEKSFSNVASEKVSPEDAFYDLEFYKNQIISECEDTLINKKLIDSLFEKKIYLLQEFGDVGTRHINVNKLYKRDTSLKALKFIGGSKISYKVDPKKLKKDIQNFDHVRSGKLNEIIIENFEINFQISKEVHRYTDVIKKRMSENRNSLVNDLSSSLNKFIICIVVVMLLMVIFIKLLVYDLSKLDRYLDRNNLFISSLLNLFKKK